MATTIPDTMKRLVLTSSATKRGDDKSMSGVKIEVQEVPVPKPKSGEVLIKVAASPINPSDYGIWSRTAEGKLPLAIGNEGSGTVVASGGGATNLFMGPSVGASVGFVGLKGDQGAYSEYVTANVVSQVYPLPDDVKVEDAASFFVNPYTAVAITSTVRDECKAKAFVHTAAASQLGQMIVRLCVKEKDLTLINVVRREEQAEILRGLGAKYVVVTGRDDPAADTAANTKWKAELKALIKEHKATVAFDAVAGTMSGAILNLLPYGGSLYVYGGLAGKVGNVDPMDLIYLRKKMNGFLLPRWLQPKGDITTTLFTSLPRLRAAGAIVNEGLAPGGWCATEFKDVALEDAFSTFLKMQKKGGFTGNKLRVRFD